MAHTPVASLRKVFHSFSGKPILKNVNLDFQSETITLITGANGSGKSTFLNILAGLIKQDKGVIDLYFTGLPVYISQYAMLYPALSAWENLRFWNRLGKFKAQETDLKEALKRLGLLQHRFTPVRFFSKGMLQKLQLTRMILHSPQLALLDEPDSGLDIQTRNILRNIILEQKAKGSCIIWVSHEPKKDSDMADQTLELRDYNFQQAQVDSSRKQDA